MDWKARFSDMCADCKRWLGQALTEWVESIKDDPVQHIFSIGAGAALTASLLWLL